MSEVQTVNEVTRNTEAEPKAAPKTRREKLTEQYDKKRAAAEKLNAELQALVDEIQSIDRLQNVEPGTLVLVTLGRGETRREVQGVVIAKRETQSGQVQYKVQYGAGFDADIAVVRAGEIRPVQEAVQRA